MDTLHRHSWSHEDSSNLSWRKATYIPETAPMSYPDKSLCIYLSQSSESGIPNIVVSHWPCHASSVVSGGSLVKFRLLATLVQPLTMGRHHRSCCKHSLASFPSLGSSHRIPNLFLILTWNVSFLREGRGCGCFIETLSAYKYMLTEYMSDWILCLFGSHWHIIFSTGSFSVGLDFVFPNWVI